MRSYRIFILVLGLLMVLYFVALYNRPKETDFKITLSSGDKIPYGSFIVYDQLKKILPSAHIVQKREPVYNVVNNYAGKNSAYFLIEPELKTTKTDNNELLDYVNNGNYVFLSSFDIGEELADTLGIKISDPFSFMFGSDSTTINFTNPAIRQDSDYRFYKRRIDGFFESFDTTSQVVLGVTNGGMANFLKVPLGKGAFFIHAAPLCFSNYFCLFRNNADYVSHALSYLPKNIETAYWDEYYKSGPTGSDNPLRFFINNEYLKWALRIAFIGLIIYIFFASKRSQRPIPVLDPVKNTSLEFVETVGNVYFQQKDNKNIAEKKITFFYDYIRIRFYLNMHQSEGDMMAQLSRKSGTNLQELNELFNLIHSVRSSADIGDAALIKLNELIDNFYNKAG